MEEKGAVTRRDFLRGTAGLLMTMACHSFDPPEVQAGQTSHVVIIREQSVLNAAGEINSATLKSMLDNAVSALSGEQQPLRAWQKLFTKSDIVGIKTNTWRYLPTPKEMDEAIRIRLRSVGIEESNIAVDDRGIQNNPVFQRSTALINVRPVRTHHWSGVGTCLKNYIMFVPVPSAYHDNGCSDLGKIWTLPQVRGKTRLNILVALTPQFFGRGAHSFDRRYVWPYNGLIVGTDPVAVDTVGAELLRAKRIAFFSEDKELDVQPIHIAMADKKYGLGVSDIRRIEITRLGWKDEMLV